MSPRETYRPPDWDGTCGGPLSDDEAREARRDADWAGLPDPPEPYEYAERGER